MQRFTFDLAKRRDSHR